MEDLIIKMYKEGKSIRAISRELGIYFNTVRNVLIVKGYLKPKVTKLNEKQLSDIKKRFKSGESISKMSKEYGVGHGLISDYLRSEGVNTFDNNNKYDYDRNIFNTIDSESKAYWLGFITADGSVSDRGLEIGLKLSDIAHLKKFCDFIGTSHEAIKVRNGESVRINVTSTQLAKDLVKHGVHPNKTFTACFNKAVINGEFARHYLRGYFDGDGYLSKNGIQSGVTSGSRSLLMEWQDHLNEVLGISRKKLRADKRSRALDVRYGKADTLKIKDYLYSNSNISLDRKAIL